MAISKDEALKRLVKMYRSCDDLEFCEFRGDCTTLCREALEYAAECMKRCEVTDNED